MKALGFGAIVWDDIPNSEKPIDGATNDSQPRSIGGAVFNVLAHLVKLGCESTMISSIGTDELGDRTIHAVAETGVGTGLLKRVDKPTCLIPVVFDETGQPSYHIPEDVSWDWIEVTGSDIGTVRDCEFDCMVFGTIEQRGEASRRGLQRLLDECSFHHSVLDVNFRAPFYTGEVVAYSLGHCTTVKMSVEEAFEISDMFKIGSKEIEPFCVSVQERFGVERIVVTAGAEGAYYHDKNGFGHCPGYHVTVSDPVGAGDAFVAGLMYRLSEGDTLAAACDFGNRMGR